MKPRILIALFGVLATSAWAPAQADVVTDWNATTLACVQGQVTPVAIPANRAGPPGLLDTALVQTAVHDAVQANQGRFEAYQYENPALRGVGSPEAAAAAAAYGVLVGLYGADDPCLASVTSPAVTYAGDPGLQAGNEAAAALLLLYRPTFALPTDPFLGGTSPGQWRPTPPLLAPGAFRFLTVTAPFVLNKNSQFRPPRQPPLSSVEYAREYDEVKSLGALNDTALTQVTRTPEQTDLALFWLTNPFHAWQATVRSIAAAHLEDVGDSARLFALVSLASADAAITTWDSKFHYNFWRPVTAIREGDNDGNPRTTGDPDWVPFTATPPYPDHSSGANNLAGSFTGILELYFGDEFEFSIASTTPGLLVNPRPYHRFSDASLDVVEVRILQGIHFRHADEQGRRQGRRVAHWVFMKSLRPVQAPAGGAQLAASEASKTITDADDPGELVFLYQYAWSSQMTITEGDVVLQVPVARIHGSSGAISVGYQVPNQFSSPTATPGNDFACASGRLSWNDGEAGTKYISVQIKNDTRREDTERFQIRLGTPGGPTYAGPASRQDIDILDDGDSGDGAGGGGSCGVAGGGGGGGGGGGANTVGGGGATGFELLVLLGLLSAMAMRRNRRVVRGAAWGLIAKRGM